MRSRSESIGGIRYLCELLSEIVERRPDLPRQHRHRRVVAHRADRLHLRPGKHGDDVRQFLAAHVEHLLIGRKRRGIHRLRGRVRVHEFGVQVAHALFEPLLVWRADLEQVVDVVVVHERAVDEIHGQHFSGAEAAFLDDVALVVVVDADF